MASESDAILPKANTEKKSKLSRKVCLALAGCFTVFVFISMLVISISSNPVHLSNENNHSSGTSDKRGFTVYYKHAAVATDSEHCSTVGREMLDKGGSALDAAIASMLCVGIYNMHSTGISGSSFMLIYERPRNGTEKELVALNSREKAPLKAKRDMFVNMSDSFDSRALNIAVFGDIAGFWEAWSRYGRLPWADLFTPTIDLCEGGFAISETLAMEIEEQKWKVTDDEANMWDLFWKSNNESYKVGDVMKLPKLAAVLRRLAENGRDEFYKGTTAELIVQDLKELGSIVELADLQQYSPQWEEPMTMELPRAKLKMVTVGAPSGGPVLQYIAQLLDAYTNETKDSIDNFHRFAEILKFAFALRTRIGDPDFVNISQVIENIKDPSFIASTMSRLDQTQTHEIKYYEPEIGFTTDGGTSHLSVYTEEGSAVGLTSTINKVYGSFLRGRRTGIIFNDGMDDFAVHSESNGWDLAPFVSNHIAPGKRPLSSMSPTIFFDHSEKVKIIIGASGGPKITTAIANALWHLLYQRKGLTDSVTSSRLHHQLSPNVLKIEEPLYEFIRRGMIEKGHEVEIGSVGVVQAIQHLCDVDKQNCGLIAVSDWRKGGKPDGF